MISTNPYGIATTTTTTTTISSSSHYNNDNTTTTTFRDGEGNITKKRLDTAKVSGRKFLTTNKYQQEQKQQQQQLLPKRDYINNDTMEYIIKFPTIQHRSDHPHTQTPAATITEDQDDFVFVYNETNIPIVLLLGWAGCQDRYLMKYSKIYEDRGLITVRYTAPVDTLFWKRSEMKPIGEKILKLIYDMHFDSHPVIFHIFSNGGAYLYQHISLAIRKHKTPLQIRGMIIDSAPGERRLLGLYRAVTAIYGRERKRCHCFTAIVITFTLGVLWFMEEAYLSFKSLFVKTEPIQTNPFNDLKNEPNEFPQLFLYSKGDVVIPYTDVEKFIAIRKQQGVHVSSMCVEDAEHVKIYTKYPAQYIQCVCNFINNCMTASYVPDAYAISPTTTATPSLGSNTSLKYD